MVLGIERITVPWMTMVITATPDSFSKQHLKEDDTTHEIDFLGGLILHLNHLIAERVSVPHWQFGTPPIGIFLSNLDSRQLEISLMTSYCNF